MKANTFVVRASCLLESASILLARKRQRARCSHYDECINHQN
ncbi:MAG: hypothetical protein WBA39_09785 [Rivularia sp. (in: cyanobacteria)]